jgi:uncharacterized protein (TIGR04255 family)
MAVPDAPRVIYEVSPLDEVICQLRFPPILRIDAESPVKFQETLRGPYPFYESRSAIRLPAGVSEGLAQMISVDLPNAGAKSHEFASRDRVWNVKLNRHFLALTCHRYDRWENFRSRLAEAVGALEKEYNPSFYTRIGLRYRNVIRRSRLPDKEPPWKWSDLIQPWIAGLLGRSEVCDAVIDTKAMAQFLLRDEVSRCTLNYGSIVEEPSQEVVFVIDADCFIEQQTEPTDALSRLDNLNREARLLFRWCITDRLHEASGPRPAD